jgi:hypothetical protein
MNTTVLIDGGLQYPRSSRDFACDPHISHDRTLRRTTIKHFLMEWRQVLVFELQDALFTVSDWIIVTYLR